MSKRALNGHWPQPRRAEASAFVLSQCAVRDLNPEPADSDYSLVGSCRYPAVETIASQRDLRFLTIGNLWLVVAICGQKMWRKVCVMATKHWTATGLLYWQSLIGLEPTTDGL